MSPSPTATKTAAKVEFIQYHKPAMESGVYQVTLTQTIENSKIHSGKKFSKGLKFAVTGERFSYLPPKDVFAVFPPLGSLGNHSNVLPHITLNRSTLPWERSPSPDGIKLKLPWLALLLLRDDDFPNASDRPQTQVITLQELKQSANFPSFDFDPGQDPTDSVTVIDLKKSLLASILPTKSDLAYLAHVRQAKDAGDQPAGDELATIICNRLPQTGGVSTVYLVSVENRYTQKSDEFNFLNAEDNDLIRLVCLYSWRFSCMKESESFSRLLYNLDRNPSTLCLPNTGTSNVDGYLSKGYVPLSHELREGDKTVSWYRGPLTAGEITDPLELPVRAADELLRYDTDSGMFDTSYAAAWELGRLLTLKNQSVALALYNWKRASIQNLKQLEQKVEDIPIQGQQTPADIPATVSNWFEDLSLLKHIPFNYLLPEENLLPVESIRFFRVDPRWIECCLDGAFSIGRVTNGDFQQDCDNPVKTSYGNLSGFLLRSDVVSGWPGLLIDGYQTVVSGEDFAPNADVLPLIRMDRLSKNVLLCLFDGEVKTVDIHLQPETMHFGVDPGVQGGQSFDKKLRSLQDGSPLDESVSVPWRDGDKQRIDIGGLASNMASKLGVRNDFHSDRFALEMIEGVQKVRFAM